MGSNLILSCDDSGVGQTQLTEPIEATEALPESIERGSLSDKRVEIKIGPHFDRLRGHDKQGMIVTLFPASAGLHTLPPHMKEDVAVEGSDASG